MTTIKKYNDGITFYDAFGEKIGETTVEEEWMGDSFNRDSICASSPLAATKVDCLDSLKDLTGYITTSASNYCDSGLTAHASGYGTACKGMMSARDQKLVVNDIAFDTTTHSLKAELQEIRAQIDALKKSMTATTKLRPSLKTLQYKSEVE